MTTSSGLLGSDIGVLVDNDIEANKAAAATFKKIIARYKIPTQYLYEDKPERIRKSENSIEECPHMSEGNFKVAGSLKAE